ncbi:hypothetical protein [Paraburkholderia tropica]|uniref:hypothetical protein n=1 Tax=Paraburkholderia tropica TaxID=92647 RepID=UPI002AB5F695|nr:hypothetical protein [Paraburkholderia tropica]
MADFEPKHFVSMGAQAAKGDWLSVTPSELQALLKTAIRNPGLIFEIVGCIRCVGCLCAPRTRALAPRIDTRCLQKSFWERVHDDRNPTNRQLRLWSTYSYDIGRANWRRRLSLP